MIPPALLYSIIIGSLLRNFIPGIDLFWLLFLVTMFSNPDKKIETLRIFALGTILASLFGGRFIGLLPLITGVIFFLLSKFTAKQLPKGLPTIFSLIVSVGAIIFLENLVIHFLTSGILIFSTGILVKFVITVLLASLISFFMTKRSHL